MRFCLGFSLFCIRLHLSFSRFYMCSISASSNIFSVQCAYLALISPPNAVPENALSVPPNVQYWRTEKFPLPAALHLTSFLLVPNSLELSTWVAPFSGGDPFSSDSYIPGRCIVSTSLSSSNASSLRRLWSSTNAVMGETSSAHCPS